MRIQTKTFYADLFSKSSGPVSDTKPRPAAIKPMAPLAPALGSQAPSPPKAPALPAPVEAAPENNEPAKPRPPNKIPP